MGKIVNFKKRLFDNQDETSKQKSKDAKDKGNDIKVDKLKVGDSIPNEKFISDLRRIVENLKGSETDEKFISDLGVIVKDMNDSYLNLNKDINELDALLLDFSKK